MQKTNVVEFKKITRLGVEHGRITDGPKGWFVTCNGKIHSGKSYRDYDYNKVAAEAQELAAKLRAEGGAVIIPDDYKGDWAKVSVA